MAFLQIASLQARERRYKHQVFRSLQRNDGRQSADYLWHRRERYQRRDNLRTRVLREIGLQDDHKGICAPGCGDGIEEDVKLRRQIAPSDCAIFALIVFTDELGERPMLVRVTFHGSQSSPQFGDEFLRS